MTGESEGRGQVHRLTASLSKGEREREEAECKAEELTRAGVWLVQRVPNLVNSAASPDFQTLELEVWIELR